MLQQATGERVEILRPLEHLSKHRVLELSGDLPLGLTFSCLAPVDGLHCGQCNKCAERRAVFRLAKTSDPTHYATLSS